ncbi:hypothetical protein BO70DRAFT_361015 [Aspergillus heteromorphus CBS 117.55]|uniref:Uncharacterized protein n=1 Tax=Aspergillus heteromorphus CBS 117.55 TaxID=1448321 RepID=A0A317WPI2_9EURO|nr:uncharacterized protein BO70DRAFT_361015 [Aspergillus heteromorphus CBS 117.55]PWY86200.1 hypothetical protein BO70DRAFT_361015 [Aspergillus heteromorphus CBS 117.55]
MRTAERAEQLRWWTAGGGGVPEAKARRGRFGVGGGRERAVDADVRWCRDGRYWWSLQGSEEETAMTCISQGRIPCFPGACLTRWLSGLVPLGSALWMERIFSRKGKRRVRGDRSRGCLTEESEESEESERAGNPDNIKFGPSGPPLESGWPTGRACLSFDVTAVMHGDAEANEICKAREAI